MKISATVLAAGKSSRMEEVNKLLLPIDGTPMIRRVTENVLLAEFNPVVVVTGFEQHKLEKALTGLEISIVNNSNWADGMAGSIFAGMSTLPEETTGNLIALGDMPLVSVQMLKRLCEEFDRGGGKIVYPVYDGMQANPVIFPKKYFGEILSATGDRGCKKVLKRYPEDAVAVTVDSDEVTLDCDNKEDYLHIQARSEAINVKA
ncbi:MAG: hypothetical protein CMG71_04200 [Candidatus Marinimicrobia bacterium]|nr:hypothetical protein [Candidatus Neomarinimicrobiota bacterium]|tara:strand:- start:4643 stop:5254 length:612 start_codon:yes stop_codon:yes gene_type:complete